MKKRNRTRISDDDAVKLIEKLAAGEDGEGQFFSKEHLALSKEERFAEDFILVGIYLIEKLNIKDVVRFEWDFFDPSERLLRAIQSDGTVVPLDLDYIDHTVPRQYAYMGEALYLLSQNLDLKRLCAEIKTKSPSYLNLPED